MWKPPPARTYDEVAATKTMIKRTDERLALKPKRLAADTAYGTGRFLNWLIGSGIMPHILVWDMSQRDDGTLSRADFTFDKDCNAYICPRIFALKANCSRPPVGCTMVEPSFIARALVTAAYAQSNPNALQI
jgi:hypothetical protein